MLCCAVRACVRGHITCVSLLFLGFLDFAACWGTWPGYHAMGGEGEGRGTWDLGHINILVILYVYIENQRERGRDRLPGNHMYTTHDAQNVHIYIYVYI